MAERLVIRGGKSLRGSAEIRGSKNAATKMMVAALLTDEPCIIENIPFSSDIDITKELCESVGAKVSLTSDRCCIIEAKEIRQARIPELSRRNRIPILALGPLLHRKGKAEVPVLGGCPIGHRPINFHVDALSKMGAKIERRERSYYAEAQKLHGAEIELPYPSVGATENVILTAILARGKTILRNAAVEPEILNLIEMLSQMGAKIKVAATNRRIEIEGVSGLKGTRVRVMPDRTEIVSFAIATLATRGEVFIKDADSTNLQAFLEKIEEINGGYESLPDRTSPAYHTANEQIASGLSPSGIRFWGKGPYRATTIETAPYPGFMTDWQPPMAVLLTQAEGESIIHETVYEDRLGYLGDLARMGVKSELSEKCLGNACRFFGQTYQHSARIFGPTALHGSETKVTDIRGGMAHLIAALVAEGESVITGIEHIDRGYEKIDARLRALGAEIERRA